jgi:hypothetical protein
MVALPVTIPVATPVDGSIDTVVASLLLHTPPAGELLSDVLAPGHAFRVPVNTLGAELTVTIMPVLQPVVIV